MLRKVPGNVTISDVSEKDEDIKRKKNLICPICNDFIQQATEDSLEDNLGQRSSFCEGQCDNWLQRQCAGLSRFRFSEISKTEAPCCPHC